MELPKPPPDMELRNIIDKLAQFVARNGPDFEQMTKNKQKGNPKFSFLFGGEYFNYYQYKVTTEQAILKVKDGKNPTGIGAGETRTSQESQLGHTGVPHPNLLNHSGANNSALSALLLSAVQGMSAGQPNLLTPPQGGGGGGSGGTGASSLLGGCGWLTATATATVESISREQAALQEQSQQSQQNLAAQQLVLVQQQEQGVEEGIRRLEGERLKREASDLGVCLTELDAVLQPIIDTCTKDSISNGKAWILQRAVNPRVNSLLARYLLYKVIEPEKNFNHKLHIIYLVNDILHHCVRKHTEEFKAALEEVVVPMFCNASLGVNEEQQAKLNKLLTIWETKNHYFSDEIVSQLHDPVVSWSKYKTERNSTPEFRSLIERLSAETKATYASFQSQHVAFVTHTMRQIQTLEQQKQQLEAVAAQQQLAAAAVAAAQQQQGPPQAAAPPPPTPQQPPPPPPQHQPYPPQPPALPLPHQPYQHDLQGGDSRGVGDEPPGTERQGGHPPPPPGTGHPPPPPPGTTHLSLPPPPTSTAPGGPPVELPVNTSQPPPGFMFPQPPLPSIELPDLTRPPPGFPIQPEVQPEDLLPSLPYFDLPAGLMVPLVKLEDHKYKPLDPDAIRLPPPAPPSERLLAAVQAFYTPPGHDQPRDSDGWEKLGLYEYFRAKLAARKKKEEDVENGLRERSRSPTPVKSWQDNAKSPPPKRRYSSRSRSRSRERERERERSGRGDKPQRRRRDRSPVSHRDRSPRHSTPSPPHFMGIGFSDGGGEESRGEERLSEGNKGHQLLKKMGWSGAGGLGAKEQGIEAPIQGADVRDKADQYKGVGVNLNDPYENFRKSKGQAFITRMKARAEERS